MVIACRGGDHTAVEERRLAPLEPGELLLKVRVVGLCGTDLFKLDNGTAAPGTVLGHELVGVVAALGDGVEGFRVGDRVAVPHHVACGSCDLCRRGAATMCEAFKENLLTPGGFADHVVVKARATARAARRLPESLSDDVAVFMEPAACVLRGVLRGNPAPDGVAVVQGGGGMGLLHLLVLGAVLPDIATVVVDPLPERRGLARELGAAAAAAPGDDARTAVEELSGGLGADARRHRGAVRPRTRRRARGLRAQYPVQARAPRAGELLRRSRRAVPDLLPDGRRRVGSVTPGEPSSASGGFRGRRGHRAAARVAEDPFHSLTTE
jgi:L-iditol 2-dehydrogenase